MLRVVSSKPETKAEQNPTGKIQRWVCHCTEAALTFAGVWDFETGLRAVQLRGEVMEVQPLVFFLVPFFRQSFGVTWKAAMAVPQAALAVAGLPEVWLSVLRQSVSSHFWLVRRNFYNSFAKAAESILSAAAGWF